MTVVFLVDFSGFFLKVRLFLFSVTLPDGRCNAEIWSWHFNLPYGDSSFVGFKHLGFYNVLGLFAF